MNLKKTMLITAALTSTAALSAFAGSHGGKTATASGEMLGNTCAGCHGPRGNSFGPAIPTIAGNAATYLSDKMKAYKSGDAPSSIMGNIAKGYSDAEIDAMAGYFSKQAYKPMAQKHDAAMAKAGKKLHDKYCEKCHSEAGTLADDESGLLSGQWMPYLEYSLADFQSGAANAPKKMATKLKKLHKKEGAAGIEKLIHYYGSAK
ncbi:MAG: c-type cytochrome [Gammaproteobacteria bacterium]|nr:c-type cytochrome [Gammaproteobacteria bacterium]